MVHLFSITRNCFDKIFGNVQLKFRETTSTSECAFGKQKFETLFFFGQNQLDWNYFPLGGFRSQSSSSNGTTFTPLNRPRGRQKKPAMQNEKHNNCCYQSLRFQEVGRTGKENNQETRSTGSCLIKKQLL